MIFKTYTDQESREWEALIKERYQDLLDESHHLVEHMAKTYQVSQSEEDCDLLIEAMQQQTKIFEDICAHEVERAGRGKRLRDMVDGALREARSRHDAMKRDEETQSMMLAVRRIDETVAHLRQQGNRKRQGFAPQVKVILIKTTEAMGGMCPCCGVQSVVQDGERQGGAEFDHFFANHIARADAGWLICQKCHRSLTHNASLRTARAVEFSIFQKHRRSIEMQPQIDMGGQPE